MTMKLSFKCYLAFVLALCLLIPFCSCGQTKTTEAKATETPSTETPTTETPTTETPTTETPTTETPTGTPVTPTPETETPTPETPIPPNRWDDPDIDPMLSSDIKRAYARTVPGSPAPEHIEISAYFGTFRGYAVVMIGVGQDILSYQDIAGYTILFGSSQRPWFYKDGKIALFEDAYNSGMLTKRDVFEFACAANLQITENELIPVNERDAARIPQDVASEMKHVYFWKLSDEGSLGKITAPEQLYVEKFYDRLGDTGYREYSYVVRMGDGKEYPDAPRTVKVGGYEIVFPNEQEVWVYHNGIFYTFVEAYDAELVDGHAIANICRRAGFKITEIQ